jgi:glycosidase
VSYQRCARLRRLTFVVSALSVAFNVAGADKILPKQTITGADGASISVALSGTDLVIEYRAPGVDWDRTVYLAFGTHSEIGSAVVPFKEKVEGSTVFLPFKADRLFSFQMSTDSLTAWRRDWSNWKWSDWAETKAVQVQVGAYDSTFRIPFSELGSAKQVDAAIYSKDFTSNPWGRIFGCNDIATESGMGDKYISRYLEINLAAQSDQIATSHARLNSAAAKIRIYQLFVRLFGNTNETRKHDGTLAENGVGKFNDINDAALKSLHDCGFNHIWLTGVLQQATAADYSNIGQPADDPDLLKGLAGSPYAIKDYFDVCPDYANDPKKRIEEFKSLLGRIHNHGMKALIDLVPNHVARSYNSDVKPDQNFGTKGNHGAGDDMSAFFSPQNNFFYLKQDGSGPPLRLPTCKDGQPVSPTCKIPAIKCDGFFDGEKDHGKVTGNNKVSWTPDINDWYETVKLNYGFDFTKADKSVREYPNANTPDKPIPDTWQKMDSVIAYWQALGVDGFRCDMSHMVPPEFWNWAISRARSRHRDVVFIGEAYDNDPAKVPGVDPIISQLHGGKSNVMFDLLDAGFNGVYDDPTYRALKKIYEGPGWANDVDENRADAFIFENSLRYAENHDEARLAAKSQWGGVGMRAGIPVSAILYGLSRGPVMIYNGQEVGEPAEGIEGFGSSDARTSIFDYWSMPELVKWVNGHKYDGDRLSTEQKELRGFYQRLMNLAGEPAFRDGICIPLNAANRDNPNYGRLQNEQASGHWLYSFVRYDPVTGQRFVVAVNLSPKTALKDIQIRLPEAALAPLGLMKQDRHSGLTIKDQLNPAALVDLTTDLGYLRDGGVPIAELPPLTACYLEIKPDK